MALDFSNEIKSVSSEKAKTLNSSTDLKKLLTPEQLKNAQSQYFAIRKSFYDSGCSMTRHDTELAELIRLKILDTILAEGF
jgi:hypothetical protein